VRVAGLILEAGNTKSQQLLKWGSGNYQGSTSQPGVISDVFGRVGGSNDSRYSQVSTEMMIQINTNDIIVDHTWLWRADHDVGGLVYDSRNPVQNGLQVNGSHVRAYGLFVEHTLGDLVSWNGDNGEVYFMQSELPYDVSQTNYANQGKTAYKLGNSVRNHHAYGVGVYSYFRDNNVTINSAISGPSGGNIKFENALSVFLNGHGSI